MSYKKGVVVGAIGGIVISQMLLIGLRRYYSPEYSLEANRPHVLTRLSETEARIGIKCQNIDQMLFSHIEKLNVVLSGETPLKNPASIGELSSEFQKVDNALHECSVVKIHLDSSNDKSLDGYFAISRTGCWIGFIWAPNRGSEKLC